MRKNKLFYLYNSLNNKEIKRLSSQLTHPFFLGNDKVSGLHKYLSKNKKALELGDYDALKEGAFAYLYPKEKYTSTKLRSVMSSLYSLVEDFLLLENLRKDKGQRNTALLHLYKQRNLDKLYFPAIEQKRKTLEEAPLRGINYHLSQVQLRHLEYFHPKAHKYKSKAPFEGLKPLHENLDAFYLLAKLQYSSEVFANQVIRGKKAEIPLLKEVLLLSGRSDIKSSPLLNIYKQVISLLDEPEETAYFRLKVQAFEAMFLLNKEDQHNLLLLLFNIAWFSVPVDRRSRESFELYQKGMELDILLENGLLNAAHFNNFVDIGCTLKEFERVRTFVKKYTPHLDTDPLTRENISTLCEAFLLFGEGKFESVLQTLNYLEYEDFSYGLRAHTLLIKSHFETKGAKGYRQIETRCEALKQYVVRKYKAHYISKSVRDEQMNFIKIMLQLPFMANSRFARVTKVDLLAELEGMKRVTNRDWLLAKIG